MFAKIVYVGSCIIALTMLGSYFVIKLKQETTVTVAQPKPEAAKPTLQWGTAAEQNEQVRKAFGSIEPRK